MKKALEYIEHAETILLTFIADLTRSAEEEEDGPDPMPMLMALQRSLGRAAGCIEMSMEKQDEVRPQTD